MRCKSQIHRAIETTKQLIGVNRILLFFFLSIFRTRINYREVFDFQSVYIYKAAYFSSSQTFAWCDAFVSHWIYINSCVEVTPVDNVNIQYEYKFIQIKCGILRTAISILQKRDVKRQRFEIVVVQRRKEFVWASVFTGGYGAHTQHSTRTYIDADDRWSESDCRYKNPNGFRLMFVLTCLYRKKRKREFFHHRSRETQENRISPCIYLEKKAAH